MSVADFSPDIEKVEEGGLGGSGSTRKNFFQKKKIFSFTPKINTKSFISTSKTQLKIAELLTFPLIPPKYTNYLFL
jgi:hypothetical protein